MNKEDLKSDSIQHMFCEKYDELPTRNWDKVETSLIMHLIKNESKFNTDPDPINSIDLLLHRIIKCPKGKEVEYENDLREIKEAYKFHYDVITRRVYLYDSNISRIVKLIIAFIVNDLAEITQILTMIQYKCWLHNDWEVGHVNFLNMFPFGVATKEASDEIWKSNKIHDKYGYELNLLDCISAMESIRKIK